MSRSAKVILGLLCAGILMLPAVASAAGIDGPGSFYVFRTRDTAAPPSPAQNAACDNYFGPLRAETVATRLNAALFAFSTDPATGRVTDQTASALGPGFICAAPQAATAGELDAYAYTALPTTGTLSADGPCSLEPIVAQVGSVIVNCHIDIGPNPATGVVGGLITSNSVINETGASGAPTGSIWTAYGIGPQDARAAAPQPVGKVVGDGAGIDFYVARATPIPGPLPSGCPDTDLAGVPDELSSVAPDQTTSRIPSSTSIGPRIGALTVCYVSAVPGGFLASATATVTAEGGSFQIDAAGECDNNETSVGNDQNCALTITSSSSKTVKAGLLTSNGLADASRPTESNAAALWTFALFGAPPAAATTTAATATKHTTISRVRITAPARTRTRRTLIRWAARGASRFDVETGYVHRMHVHWHGFLSNTRLTHTTVTLRSGLAAVRVRVHLADGRRGAWSTVKIRVS
jgi:hypothetical protein